jgi:hypothetical protein
MPSTTLQRSSSCGRLIAYESGNVKDLSPFTGTTNYAAINFPAMPDSIELARSVDYMVVPSQVMPDGLHQYKWTNPMTIPFSFRLHSFDREFCPRGALSLMETVALLHSFSLPLAWFGPNGTRGIATSYGAQNPATPASGADNNQSVKSAGSDSSYNAMPDAMSKFSPPVTLRLELITIGSDQPGIVCMGYVKDVKAKLNGPWLRGPNGARNLPTSADFDFSFVHVPGHGNQYDTSQSTIVKSGRTAQAYGQDVKQTLYNTVGLIGNDTIGYQGFDKKS